MYLLSQMAHLDDVYHHGKRGVPGYADCLGESAVIFDLNGFNGSGFVVEFFHVYNIAFDAVTHFLEKFKNVELLVVVVRNCIFIHFYHRSFLWYNIGKSRKLLL